MNPDYILGIINRLFFVHEQSRRGIACVAMTFLMLLTGSLALWCQQKATPQPTPKPSPYTPRKPTVAVKVKSPAPRPANGEMSDLDRFRNSRQKDQLLSSTIDQDHEDAGVETAQGGPYTGVFALHAVYPTGSIRLTLPDHATRTQILYAATTRPPNGSCLEVGTAYVTDINTKQTAATVYVYDFCKAGGGDFAIPPIPTDDKQPIQIDNDFMVTYAGAQTSDIPAYALAIYTPDSTITSSSTWYAQLFNYRTKQWQTLYSTTGSFPYDPRGWSIFETYFQSGLCSESLPPLGADEISFFNASTQTWERAAAQMPSGLAVHISYGGAHNNNCFAADPTGPASYLVVPQPPAFYWWQVRSR
jgi:hypothetical protein